MASATATNPLLDGALVFGIGRSELQSIEQTFVPSTKGETEGISEISTNRLSQHHPLFWFAVLAAAGLTLVGYSTERASIRASASVGDSSAAAGVGIGGEDK